MAPQAPPPSRPAGIPPSGNGKYIALALLLLGLVGAVIIWKVTQKPVEPPIVTQIVDAGPAPPPSHTDDDIPLPPPIEDAGPDAQKKIVYVGLASQCDAKKCTGKTSSELEQTLAFRAKQAHRCYDNALTQDPTLKGKVSIAVRVGANGSVCSAGVSSNDMGSPLVANCVAGYFRSGSFPAPKGGCIDVNVPINFVPRQ
jgi:hypothetical protein